MYLDIDELKPINSLSWHSIPSEEYGIIKKECYKVGKYELLMFKNPLILGNEALVEIEYSMIAKLNGNNVLTINLEKDDLRALSKSFNCSLKDIQEDYHTKKNYGKLHSVLYSSNDKEDLGIYTGENDIMSLRLFFVETLLDALDCFDEIEPLF